MPKYSIDAYLSVFKTNFFNDCFNTRFTNVYSIVSRKIDIHLFKSWNIGIYKYTSVNVVK